MNKLLIRGVCAIPNHDLRPQLDSFFDQLLVIVQLSLASFQYTPDGPLTASLLKSVKWGLKSIQQYCASSLPIHDALYVSFASLSNTVLFALFQDQTQSLSESVCVRDA